jgi:hypothetical protein
MTFTAPFRITMAARETRVKLAVLAVALVLGTLLVDGVLILRGGQNTETHGDGPYYIGLARSLAAGKGYYLANSFHANAPNVSRSPLWPAMLSVPARLVPGANDNAILRWTAAAMHALCSAAFALLAFQMCGSLTGAAGGGLLMALYPPAIGLVVGGYSELIYMAAMSAGMILLLEGGGTAWLCPLLWGAAVMVALTIVVLRPAGVFAWPNVRRFAVACVIFAALPAAWVVRNYAVSGRLVMSAMEGETLYGANNARVANDLSVWGYWIMPDEIPGELTKRELAARYDEAGLSTYYHDRAVAFIRANLPAMPRLLLGKLIRGFVPVPWVPLAASYVAFLSRACVYAAFLAALRFWRTRHGWYLLLAGAMSLVLLVTTLVYYGTFRFTFCVEPFLFPVIAAGALDRLRRAQ